MRKERRFRQAVEERREELRREENRLGMEREPRPEEREAAEGSRYRVPEDPQPRPPRDFDFAEIGRLAVLGMFPGFPGNNHARCPSPFLLPPLPCPKGLLVSAWPPLPRRVGGGARIPGHQGYLVRDPAAPTPPTPRLYGARRSDLQQNWSEDYEASPTYKDIWRTTRDSGGEWPEGCKVLHGKLFRDERLCVPESRVWGVCAEYHEAEGHMSTARLTTGLELRFEFPPGFQVAEKLDRVRRNCLVCQASQAPKWSSKQPLALTPIPPPH